MREEKLDHSKGTSSFKHRKQVKCLSSVRMSLILPTPRSSIRKYSDDPNTTANATTLQDLQLPYNQWLASVVVSAVLIAIVSYCLMAVVFYRCKKICRRSKHSDLVRMRGVRSGRSAGGKRRIVLLVLSLIVYISVIVYFCMQLSMVVERKEPFCAYLTRASNVCGLLVLSCVYLSLWYRLNVIFYVHFKTKLDNLKTAVHLLNKSALLLLVVATAFNAYSFITSPPYATTPAGCVKVQSRRASRAKWYGLISSTVLFQIVLLFLYVYPLQLHRQCALDRGVRSDYVIRKIKRACAVAIVCVASDVGNVLVALFYDDPLHWTRYAVYGANLTINAVSLIFACEDWRRCLFPFLTFSSRASVSRVSTIRTITYEYPPSVPTSPR